jgi:hypothetical protein
MEAADETRKYWASLLAGGGQLHSLALRTWLGLAARALGADASAFASPPKQEPMHSTRSDGATPVPSAASWAALLGPVFNAWTEAVDNMQGSVWMGLSPPAENPLWRLFTHPATIIGGESSPGRLWMQAGLALVDFMQSLAAHQALQSQGWMKALQRFAAEFTTARGGEARPVIVASLDDLVTHWSTVGEAALQEHSRSEQFLRSQADMLRKAMRYRVAHRRALEAASRANDLPTLTDIDEAFASIHELRNEVRGLRRLLEAAGSVAAADAPVSSSKAQPSAGPPPA